MIYNAREPYAKPNPSPPSLMATRSCCLSLSYEVYSGKSIWLKPRNVCISGKIVTSALKTHKCVLVAVCRSRHMHGGSRTFGRLGRPVAHRSHREEHATFP
jgi:hypothetical protein